MVFYKVEARRDMPEKENEMSTREKRAICSCLVERSYNFIINARENVLLRRLQSEMRALPLLLSPKLPI